jgi:hypothetical protein
MITFESDIADTATTIPSGAQDQLDEWYARDLVEFDQAWAEWQELTFDPDL